MTKLEHKKFGECVSIIQLITYYDFTHCSIWISHHKEKLQGEDV